MDAKDRGKSAFLMYGRCLGLLEGVAYLGASSPAAEQKTDIAEGSVEKSSTHDL